MSNNAVQSHFQMNYQESLAYISSLEGRGWRLELDRMEHFIDVAGLRSYVTGPEKPKYFHVAGTNGKGSVTAFLQSALVSVGISTGAFFSPYVLDPRERIQIERELVKPDDFATVATAIRAYAELMDDSEFGGVTEFEFKTAMGFATWRRAGCRAVALEVGLGGRLDATNVVAPAACGIVSIGLDHTAILGPDLESIGGEKAGIIKPKVPVVVGEMDSAPRERILARAKILDAAVWRVGHDITYDSDSISTPAGTVAGVKPMLVGRWQMHNAAVAIGMLHAGGIVDPRINHGINQAAAPGRFEIRNFRGHPVILDGAHNGPAAVALVQTISQNYPGVEFTLITNMLAGHHASDFYQPVSSIARRAIIAPIFNVRARTPNEAQTELAPYFDQIDVLPSISEAFLAARGPILVTGSNYLVGDAIRFLDSQ